MGKGVRKPEKPSKMASGSEVKATKVIKAAVEKSAQQAKGYGSRA